MLMAMDPRWRRDALGLLGLLAIGALVWSHVDQQQQIDGLQRALEAHAHPAGEVARLQQRVTALDIRAAPTQGVSCDNHEALRALGLPDCQSESEVRARIAQRREQLQVQLKAMQRERAAAERQRRN
jgi:hypothetical protein